MKERVLILYNLAERLEKGIPSDLICEQEIVIIVPLVAELLVDRGYRVDVLKANLDLWDELRKRKGNIDIVLNLAEAFGGSNTNETVVPAILEGLDISFTGASAHNMNFTLDKEKTKLVLAAYGIPTAPYQLFRTGEEKLENKLDFPLIVKPVREEASIGIHYDSVVNDENVLRKKFALMNINGAGKKNRWFALNYHKKLLTSWRTSAKLLSLFLIVVIMPV